MLSRLARLFCCAVGLSIADVSASADRALLIGIGDYGPGAPLPDLPGIEVDLAKMSQAAEVLGVAPRDVRVLRDREATAAGIRTAVEQWLIGGTAAGDRVLLYFSGHGSRVRDSSGDEDDGWDEVLVAHDVQTLRTGGSVRVSGVLTDDELAALLRRLPERDVTVIVDACSSGTATRAGGVRSGGPWHSKAAVLDHAVPERAAGRTHADWGELRAPQAWISLAAVADGQDALSGPAGSVFTQALHVELFEARRRGAAVTPESLRVAAAAYLARRFGREPNVPGPVVDGPSTLVTKGIALVGPDRAAPVRRQLDALSRDDTAGLIAADRTAYRIEEKIRLRVSAPAAGYLNVIAVDANDEPRVLFPNAWHPDNRLRGPTTLVLGEPTLGFGLVAVPPAGTTYIYVIYTDLARPVNFYHEALAEYGEAQGVQSGLARLSTSALLVTKGIRVTAPPAGYRAQRLLVQVSQ
jgi:hypothetical protein